MLFRKIIFTGILALQTAQAAINCPEDKTDQYSSVVKIIRRVPDGDRQCTGAVVNSCFILTAAHCVFIDGTLAKPTAFTIKTGPQSNIDLGKVTAVYPHPKYSMPKNDIAVLRLSNCLAHSLEMQDIAPVLGDEVMVGGYGVIKLNSFQSQYTRRIGPNKIASITDQDICLGESIVAEDGVQFVSGAQCLPVGQDSGSPLLLKGKISGVFHSLNQSWLADGTTKILGACSINIQRAEVRSFLKDVMGSALR